MTSQEESKKKELKLTPEEESELKKFPIPYSPADEKQFILRQNIAKKLCAYFMEVDNTLTDKFREIYTKYPMWKFYYDEKSKLCKRSYGVAITMDGKPVHHTATCLLFYVNYTVGGADADSLIGLEKWTDEQIDQIKSKSMNKSITTNSFLACVDWVLLDL